ncbi:MAG: 50S ribosomal protein L22 [bacterium]|nr:50S ribosomal protein L22 [bacterium]
MAESKAKLSYLRIAPRKVRLVADMVRGKKVGEAGNILNFAVKRGAGPVLKLLHSAIANAENNLHLNKDNLYISKITVDEGPKFKRVMPRARGSASPIQKKTSHITIVLSELNKSKATDSK